jgi:zinc transport system substrate-binding protein
MVLILALVVAASSACGAGASAAGGRDVVAAFYPLAFAAERVGGPSVDVTNLTPAGAEPHDIELSVRDVERVRGADLVLYLRGFQPALDDAVDGGDVQAVDLLAGAGAGAGGDPHVWLDPVALARIAEGIGVALGAPARGRALAADLRALDRDFAAGLADCERREIVTSHAAFGHLATRYGLEQVALTGLAPEAEPSAGALERLVDEVRAHGATTVFTEPLLAPDLAETVAREAGARVAVLDPLEGLTDEELAAGQDYFTVMRANLAALRAALGCR